MPNSLVKGFSFWHSDASGAEHLCFVISDVFDDNRVLVVNMTSLHDKKKADLSCILDVGDHRAIRHRSYIFYAEARIFSAVKILNGIMNGSLRQESKIVPVLLKRIQDGAKSSKVFPRKFRQYFKYF